MGSCNPKPQPLIPPKKQQLQLCCKRLKYHLQIKQGKINNQIINGQPQLVKRINVDKNQRNKFQELLLMQRIVNGLKYTAVYTLLIEYLSSISTFAQFICDNINDDKKLQPWQEKLYSLLYAAEKMPLNTLQDLKRCLQCLDNDILMEQYVNPQIKAYLTPQPTPQEINIYMLEMSQRNNLPLDKINEAGHDFSPDFKPKAWDDEFKKKSNQFRNSLPKDQISGKNDFSNGQNQGFSLFGGGSRKSLVNPFDKKNLIQPGKKNDDNEISNNQKIDQNDISPNITDIMKKIGSSKANQ